MTDTRAPRVWHIEARYGYHYATNQYGGFTRFGTEEEATRHVNNQIRTNREDRWA